MATLRVASRLEDLASVEREHGRALVGDILHDHANRLREGGHSIFMPLTAPVAKAAETIEALRAHAVTRAARIKANERADGLIEEAWLLEGHAIPLASPVPA